MMIRIKTFLKSTPNIFLVRPFAVILDDPKSKCEVHSSTVQGLAFAQNPLFVDKTIPIFKFIKESRSAPLVFFTRPRRFGKSLMLSIVETFFDGTLDDAIYSGGDVSKMVSVNNAAFTGALSAYYGKISGSSYQEPSLTELVGKNVKKASEMFRAFFPTEKSNDIKDSLALLSAMDGASVALKRVQFMQRTQACIQKLSILNPKDNHRQAPSAIEARSVFKLDFSNISSVNSESCWKKLLYQTISGASFIEAAMLGKYSSPHTREILDMLQNERHVLLIDEHDAAIHQYAGRDENKLFQTVLDMKAIFQTAKAKMVNTAFSVVTGGTKLSSIGLWSGGNQYVDVSLKERAAEICGYTKKEVEEILNMVGCPEKIAELEEAYNGYRFSTEVDTKVYNPYAINHYIDNRSVEDFWSKTGLTGVLFSGSDDSKKLALSLLARATAGLSISINKEDIDSPIDPGEMYEYPELILLQSGIFTLLSYDNATGECHIGFPNLTIKKSTQKILKSIWYSQLKMKKYIEEANEALNNGTKKAFCWHLNILLKKICKYAGVKQNSEDTVLYEHALYNLVQVARSLLTIPTNITWPEKFNVRNAADLCILVRDTMHVIEFKSLREKGLYENARRRAKGKKTNEQEVPEVIKKRITDAAEQAKKHFIKKEGMLGVDESAAFVEFTGIQMGIDNILDYVHIMRYELLKGRRLGKLLEETSYCVSEDLKEV